MKTIFFCHHLFLGSKRPGHPLHQHSWAQPLVQRTAKSGGPTRGLGTEAQATGRASGGSALAGFGRPPARTHTLGPGTEEERGPTHGLGSEAQATCAKPAQHTHNPALLPRTRRTSGRQTPTSAHARRERPGTGKSGGGPSTLATPPCSRFRTPSRNAIHHLLSQGPMVASPPRNYHSASRFHQTRCPALSTAPARGMLGFWRWRPAWGSWSFTLARGPPAAPRAGVVDVHSGWRAHALSLGMCALPGGPAPVPGSTFVVVRAGLRAPRPRSGPGSWTCTLAGRPTPAPPGRGCICARWPADRARARCVA